MLLFSQTAEKEKKPTIKLKEEKHRLEKYLSTFCPRMRENEKNIGNEFSNNLLREKMFFQGRFERSAKHKEVEEVTFQEIG